MHTCWMMGSSEVVVLYLMRSTSCKGFSDFVVIRSYDLSYGKTRPYESLYQKGKTLNMSFSNLDLQFFGFVYFKT